jgi:hypothetical protein
MQQLNQGWSYSRPTGINSGLCCRQPERGAHRDLATLPAVLAPVRIYLVFIGDISEVVPIAVAVCVIPAECTRGQSPDWAIPFFLSVIPRCHTFRISLCRNGLAHMPNVRKLSSRCHCNRREPDASCAGEVTWFREIRICIGDPDNPGSQHPCPKHGCPYFDGGNVRRSHRSGFG